MRNRKERKRPVLYTYAVILISLLVFGTGCLAYAETYEYDKLGRIKKVTYEDGTFETYTYDKNGNMTKHAISDGTNIPESGSTGETLPDAPDNGGLSEANTEKIPVSGIRITGISGKIAAGKTVQLTAEITPADATEKAVIWSSSNNQYAVVTADGRVSVKKAGAGKSVTITAVAADGSNAAGVYKITIMKDAVKSIKLSVSKKEVKAGKSIRIKANINTSGKKVNKSLVWSSSNDAYATVNKSGKVKTKKEGKGKTVTITAKTTDGSGKKAKVKLKIK